MMLIAGSACAAASNGANKTSKYFEVEHAQHCWFDTDIPLSIN